MEAAGSIYYYNIQLGWKCWEMKNEENITCIIVIIFFEKKISFVQSRVLLQEEK